MMRHSDGLRAFGSRVAICFQFRHSFPTSPNERPEVCYGRQELAAALSPILSRPPASLLSSIPLTPGLSGVRRSEREARRGARRKRARLAAVEHALLRPTASLSQPGHRMASSALASHRHSPRPLDSRNGTFGRGSQRLSAVDRRRLSWIERQRRSRGCKEEFGHALVPLSPPRLRRLVPLSIGLSAPPLR